MHIHTFHFFHTMSLLLECVDHNACANEKELFMDEVPHLIVECTTGASTEMADPKRVRGVDMKLTMLMRWWQCEENVFHNCQNLQF